MSQLDADPLKDHPKFETLQLLGAGSYGTVIRARKKQPNARGERPEVAIKLIARGDGLSRHVEAELIQHSKFWHPHVVRLNDIFLTPTHLAVVLDLVPGGDLFSYVKRQRGCRESQARWIFQQLMMGIDYVHKMGVSQRDIKLENTLVVNPESQYPEIKITDFGLCKGPDQSECKTAVGTPEYMAPEVLLGGVNYDGKLADMWSCGVMLYVLLYCVYPFRLSSTNLDQLLNNKAALFQFTIPEQPPVSNSCKDLLRKLLTVDTKARLNLEGCLAHPWFLEKLPPQAQAINEDCLRKSRQRLPKWSEDHIRQLVRTARLGPRGSLPGVAGHNRLPSGS